MNERNNEELSVVNPKKVIGLVAVIILAIVMMFATSSLIETCSAGFYQVKQAAVTGTMTARLEPGMYWQGFARITEYNLSDIFHFSNVEGEGERSERNAPVRVRFNDGGKATIAGNVRYDLPSNEKGMIDLHKRFRSYSGFQREGVEQLVKEAVSLTAALMTADESYTTKRALFSEWAWDQVSNGIFLTEERIEKTVDPITQEVKIRKFVEIKLDKDGKPLRKPNVLKDYGVNLSQFVVNEIDYEEGVDKQIGAKREALMQTIAARARAEKAQQDRLTAEAEGQKNVAVAHYAALEVKEREIVNAERKVEVARQDKLAAREYKEAKYLRAAADAEYARKQIQADGALDRKLKAIIEIQRNWAAAVQNSGQPWVPRIVIGGNGKGGGSVSGAQDLIDLLVGKTANDLSLNLSIPKGGIGRQSSNLLPRLGPIEGKQADPAEENRVAVISGTQSGVECGNCGGHNTFKAVSSSKVGKYWQCTSCNGITRENPRG